MEKYLQCPIVIPVVMLLISVYLVVAPIVDNPQIEYLYSIIFMLAGRSVNDISKIREIRIACCFVNKNPSMKLTLWPIVQILGGIHHCV